jgi:uncharacterized ParB-like nuclease family protein
MRLLLENWKKYLDENIFYVSIEKLLPTEELGHGKDHDCPSKTCDDIIQQKMDSMKAGDIKPIEVCNQKPVNPYRLQGQPSAPKTGMSEPFYYVLDGHHRLEAAKRLGLAKMPVYLTPKETK